MSDEICDQTDESGVCQKPEIYEEGDIDEHLNSLEPDDPVLINAIQNYYIDKPNPNFEPNIPAARLQKSELAVSNKKFLSIVNVHR